MADEKRLIELGELIDNIDWDNDIQKWTLRGEPEDIPTEYAVEVVHGEWEKQQGIYSCSICGKACPYDVQADIIQYWHCNYCPNCGAKMDGQVETEHGE